MLITPYLAGKFSEHPGNAEWWIFKVCSVAFNAVLFLLILDAWKQDGYTREPKGEKRSADVNALCSVTKSPRRYRSKQRIQTLRFESIPLLNRPGRQTGSRGQTVKTALLTHLRHRT
jgi:hypothetical protein